jgi:multidrug efflux pump subunit AcrA (membrane-fusion protein)
MAWRSQDKVYAQEFAMIFKALTNKLVLLVLLALTGCNTLAGKTPTPLPTIVLGSSNVTPSVSFQAGGGGVTASGIVAPAQEAQITFSISGKVKTVNVAVGDQVKAGQPLAQLEGQESLEAAISTAQFELEQARQALEDLKTAAETARVQAMQDVVTYERAVRDAQYALDNFTVPTNQENMDAVEALNQMKKLLDEARAAFEPYKNKPSSDPTRKDLREALDEAQADYNAAVKRLQYEYNLDVAQAKLNQALKDYEMYKAGPDPDKVRLAEARQANAETQLSAAQAALDHLTLSAPFTGTVARVNIHGGEWVIAGQPILELADLDHLQIETTDLSERDIPMVQIGQPVTVLVKALNQVVMGRITAIAPLADTLGGDVVYKTTIILDTLPPGLRAGMSVDVQFGTGP